MGASATSRSRWSGAALIAAGSVASLFALSFAVNGAADESRLLADAQQAFQPLPKDMATPEFPITPERVELGRMLFFDSRASADGTASCARCHEPFLYGTDGLNKPHGARDAINPRNAPTVLNAALQFNAHWRGDRKNVEDQATQALIGPTSFGNPDYDSAIRNIKAIPGYSELFAKAFPGEQDPVTPENWGRAIGSYERMLTTPSRFDQYLSGNAEVLSSPERRGLRTFLETGCAACHNGPGGGGSMFQKFGVVEDYWKETGSTEIDKGRFDVTHDDADMYVFKVPSLRNVAMTPPYFHDGAINTLPEAVRIMAKVQLGKDLAQQDIENIVAFLESLTGQLPDDFRELPVLPPSAFAAAGNLSTGSGKH
jgi:cytochrome c peroxidase